MGNTTAETSNLAWKWSIRLLILALLAGLYAWADSVKVRDIS
jgi:hypothetical protein